MADVIKPSEQGLHLFKTPLHFHEEPENIVYDALDFEKNSLVLPRVGSLTINCPQGLPLGSLATTPGLRDGMQGQRQQRKHRQDRQQ
jgi:hypothetical protein